MVYSNDEDYALENNFDSWNEYTRVHKYPTKKKLAKDRTDANAIINRWIGCKNVDIADAAYTDYLNQLEVEVIMRKHDKGVDRKAGEAKGIYSPHDYLYTEERKYLVQIGEDTGYRVRRGVRAE